MLTYHFKCISSNVKHRNHICPICRSTWKDMPLRPPTANGGLRRNPNATSSGTCAIPVKPLLLWAEPQHFSDDESLPHIQDPPISASQANNLVTIRAFPEFADVRAAESRPALSVLVGLRSPSLPEDSRQFARAPVDLVTILDVSGSMGGINFCLPKHAVHFVIDNLCLEDRLSIVALSSRARRIFPLCRMSGKGRDCAILAVNSHLVDGSTNIAEGLRKGVKVLKERRQRNPVTNIILLSDEQGSSHIPYQAL